LNGHEIPIGQRFTRQTTAGGRIHAHPVVSLMTRRHIHYEAAFEDYLRSQGIAYIAVDEKKKAIFSGARVKSFDFLVYREPGETWLVDVKGRKFPYDTPSHKRYWENWLTLDDLDGLKQWEDVFGGGFVAMVVFAYLLLGPEDRQPTPHVHPYRDEYYAFLAIPAADYAAHARKRSDKWGTVSVAAKTFRSLARPIQLRGDASTPSARASRRDVQSER